MAEKRAKTLSILLHGRRKTRHTVELFPAEQWPEQDGRPGMFRVRLDRKWLQRPDKHTFFAPLGIGEEIGGLLGKSLGLDVLPSALPYNIPPVGASVRVSVPGRTYKQAGRVVSGVLIAEDGSFQVLVSFQSRQLFYRGRQLVLLDQIELAV